MDKQQEISKRIQEARDQLALAHRAERLARENAVKALQDINKYKKFALQNGLEPQ